MTSPAAVAEMLNDMSYEELKALNNQVVEMAKAKRNMDAIGVKAQLHVGQIVQFNDNQLRGMDCEIIKINQTRVKVQTPIGIYNVPINFIII